MEPEKLMETIRDFLIRVEGFPGLASGHPLKHEASLILDEIRASGGETKAIEED